MAKNLPRKTAKAMVEAVRWCIDALGSPQFVSPANDSKMGKARRGGDLDAADWSSRASVPHRTRRTPGFKEDWVIGIRHQLRQYSDLGEFGAAAIRREWLIQGLIDPPAVRTIGRILERRGRWTDKDGYAAVHRSRVGICRRWRCDTASWIVSMSLKDW